MKSIPRCTTAIQILPYTIDGNKVILQPDPDDSTVGYAIYRRMNDDMSSWIEDHGHFTIAYKRALYIAKHHGVPMEVNCLVKSMQKLQKENALPPPPKAPVPGEWYITQEGDSLDSISKAAYGVEDKDLATLIHVRNIATIRQEGLLEAGLMIDIPL